jgi:nucleoid DNA-binding protein
MAAKKKSAPKAATRTKKASATASSRKAAPAPNAVRKRIPVVRDKPWTQAQLSRHLADAFEMPAREAKAILDEIATVAERHLTKGGVGVFTLPGVVRLRVAEKPATKKRMGRNPRTGEEIVIPAKRKSRVVRARPVKALKDSVT